MKSALILTFGLLCFSACGSDTCTTEESQACSTTHATCTSNCTTNNPTDAAAAQACAATCNTQLCDCQSACGNTCE